MTGSTRRRGQGFSLLALAAVCALIGGLLSTGDSTAALHASLAAGSGSPIAKPLAKTTSPTPTPTPMNTSGFPTLPSGYQCQGGTMSPVVQRALRPKVDIQLAPFSVLAEVHNVPRPFTGGPSWIDTDALLYVDSPAAAGQRFGLFAPVSTAVLGFGMLPVTATIHLSQPTQGSTVEPLVLGFSWTGSPDVDGWLYQQDLTITGDVNIRISDVAVDGVPLPVGPACESSTPARLKVRGIDGRYKNSPPVRDPTDIYLPFGRPPGTLKGTVDIPSFTGCRNDDENLDPLVTTMISGPGNPISATQIAPLSGYTPPQGW